MKIKLLLLLSSLYVSVKADGFWTSIGYHSGDSEISTCNDLISASFIWDYNSTNALDYSYMFDSMCNYPPAMGTTLLCAQAYSYNDTKLFGRILESAAFLCHEYTIYHVTVDDLLEQLANATEYFQPLDTIANISEPFYVPTLPDLETGEPELIGYLWYYYSLDSGTWFSVGICGYFLLVIIIGSAYNFIRVGGLLKSIGQFRVVKLFQEYIIYPTLLPNGKYSQMYGWKWFSILFPNRIQFVVDLGLFALQVAFYCVPYHQNEGAVFATPKDALTRMVSDRTGVMAFGKIPLLILFAGRNNFLLYITGWSYATFLHFHKILALWMSVDVLIHSVGYTILELGYYTAALKEVYFACGVAATVLCFIICGFALHTVRSHYYEYFLISHILLAIGFIAMCWWHCNELGWMEWMVSAVAVWGFDRFVRIIRMTGFGYRDATIKAVGDHLLQVSVPRPSWWSLTSGQYGYIYFSGILFWQNHPFTMVCKGNDIIAYIKVKNGMTKRIWEELSKTGGTMTKKVSIEGPYGSTGSGGIKKMEELFLFAGGSGAPAILDSASHLSKGKLFWVIPDMSMVKTYSDLFKDVRIPTEIFITRETGVDATFSMSTLLQTMSSVDTASSEEKGSLQDSEKGDLASSEILVNINYQRPDLNLIVKEEIANSVESSIGILGCGPATMMDTLQNVVADSTSSTDKTVNFYNELQVW